MQAVRDIALLLPNLDIEAQEQLLADLDPILLQQLANTWQLHARPAQLRPANCAQIWVIKSGRGAGKTRSGAEHTLDLCEDWGCALSGAIVSKSIGDVRDVMIEGVSGLAACARRRGYHIDYVVNRSIVNHPSGAKLHVMSAESSEFGRGPNLNYFWADEVGAWPKAALSRMQQFLPAWRMPAPTHDGKPIATITMTPKPNAITRWLLRSKEMEDKCTVVTEHTVANAAHIDASALLDIYKGTKLGRQELEGVLLDDEGAILDQDTIHRNRVHSPPEFERVVVAIDPAVTDRDTSDDTGIVVVGEADKHAYVLADYTMPSASAAKWAARAVRAYQEHDATAIVIETNAGGDLLRPNIDVAADAEGIFCNVIPVWAKLSKRARAEPVAALYERNRVHHVGHFPELERELTGWVPGAPSPNRLDALVWAVSNLLLGDKGTIRAYD